VHSDRVRVPIDRASRIDRHLWEQGLVQMSKYESSRPTSSAIMATGRSQKSPMAEAQLGMRPHKLNANHRFDRDSRR
jgi:hypothetical protein